MEEQTLIESLIGVPIPDFVLWIVLGVIVLVAVGLFAWGFIKELKKK